ncbi:hypothetical protein [Tenacibaculum finnmarkense]|uniref:hypothetical protein n=1 Tax=Tenacibaculum finnmarkense TaxID=2781243 RepID=UPI001EFBA385|nr:hypothetical protein [Tenacibaculum finnmarkense]MCG8236077.1 hypothetical protein [Tenacibaculum finnmarkense genomovar ulcerans]MCG8830234.1 hypothetical protein [Tenacibaculum finnmarkense]
MSSKFDATTKILGFKYQEMVALKESFEAKDDVKIYLECLGDVSDGKVSTEVKHSIDTNKKLIDTHIDFWKTLSNILTEYDTFRFYHKFIFHTTAEIKIGSIFENWGKLTKEQKLEKIIAINSNDTISLYHSNVLKFNEIELKSVLDKFIIRDKQQSSKEYYQNVLLNHSAIINQINRKDREPFICSLLGFISKELIVSTDYIWNIDILNFRENFRTYANQYQISNLKFPISKINLNSISRDNYHFVKELESIDYNIKIGKSMEHYLKASDSQLKMIETRLSLTENLDNYDDDITEIVTELKDSHIDKLDSTMNLKEKSRRFFDDSIDKVITRTEIEGVTNIRVYYPKGRFLHGIETKSINLNLK